MRAQLWKICQIEGESKSGSYNSSPLKSGSSDRNREMSLSATSQRVTQTVQVVSAVHQRHHGDVSSVAC